VTYNIPVPAVKVFTFDDGNLVVHAVNWFDFEGFEVRIAHTPVYLAQPVGYVYESADRYDNVRFIAADQPGRDHDTNKRSFDTFEQAVEYLARKSSQLITRENN
jgi:hypothetical protein